jgi:hypothetical protein
MLKYRLSQEDTEYTEIDLITPQEDSTELDHLPLEEDDVKRQVNTIKEDAWEEILKILEREQKDIDVQEEHYNTLQLYKNVLSRHGLSKGIHALIDPNNKFQFNVQYLPDTPSMIPECQIVMMTIDVACEGLKDFFKSIWKFICRIFEFFLSAFARTMSTSIHREKGYTGETYKDVVESIRRDIIAKDEQKVTAANVLETYCTDIAHQVVPLGKMIQARTSIASASELEDLLSNLQELQNLQKRMTTEIRNNKEQTWLDITQHSLDEQRQRYITTRYQSQFTTILESLEKLPQWKIHDGVDYEFKFKELFLNTLSSSNIAAVQTYMRGAIELIKDGYSKSRLESLYNQNCTHLNDQFYADEAKFSKDVNHLKTKIKGLTHTTEYIENKLPSFRDETEKKLYEFNDKCVKQVNAAFNNVLMLISKFYMVQFAVFLRSVVCYSKANALLNALHKLRDDIR